MFIYLYLSIYLSIYVSIYNTYYIYYIYIYIYTDLYHNGREDHKVLIIRVSSMKQNWINKLGCLKALF